jgi:hypothetical protein
MVLQQTQPARALSLVISSLSLKKNYFFSLAPVAHACNPKYSGDRDREESGQKPALN